MCDIRIGHVAPIVCRALDSPSIPLSKLINLILVPVILHEYNLNVMIRTYTCIIIIIMLIIHSFIKKSKQNPQITRYSLLRIFGSSYVLVVNRDTHFW